MDCVQLTGRLVDDPSRTGWPTARPPWWPSGLPGTGRGATRRTSSRSRRGIARQRGLRARGVWVGALDARGAADGSVPSLWKTATWDEGVGIRSLDPAGGWDDVSASCAGGFATDGRRTGDGLGRVQPGSARGAGWPCGVAWE